MKMVGEIFLFSYMEISFACMEISCHDFKHERFCMVKYPI